MNAPEPDDSAPRVRPDSHLTLHYRISLARTGDDVISTFAERPATLTLGLGQLVEPLERCLVGLSEGDSATFDLEPEQAFGARSADLLQRVSSRLLAEHGEPGATYQPGDLLDFAAPDGTRYAGVVKDVDADGALLDFNHPLAGQPIRFEVRILGVL
ncbi:MAG: FKBP-type peptidyl-prolyl cis-trans isomerase [Burkholderiaceae bacterium]|jgi:FKBP-type peptidyl-prolyl cis-trans isomerase SlpA